MVVLVLCLGYGTHFLAQSDKPPLDKLEALREQENTGEREVPGHHAVAEWSATRERKFAEAPLLESRTAAGNLPPVAQRLPRDPLVIVPPEQIGPYGGTWNMFGTGPADIGVLASLSYETLVRWDPLLQNFHPNLAVDWSIEDGGRVFTFHLRTGVRWSDGEPFDADDLLFWYNHILLNSDLTPLVPEVFLRGGQVMDMEKIDDHTVRISFKEPHGLFMKWIANPLLEEMVKYPRHYFRHFHPDFVAASQLHEQARELGFSFWYQVFLDKAAWHNAEKPTLYAWRLTQPPPARRITFERNPYYWKVDPHGNQLPYIDSLTFEITARETMTLRFLQGDMGVQHRHVDPRNYSLFMEHRRQGDYRVLKWISSSGSGVLMPNLNHRDPEMRALFNDRRFRLALSHAIDRRQISEARYLGMGRPMQMSPTFTSPLYRPEYAEAHTAFDREKANRLLDEMGLTRRDRRGMRLLPNGEPLLLTIEMFDLVADVGALQLVADSWKAVGIDTEVKQLALSLYYERMPARLHDIAIGSNSSMHTPLLDHMYTLPFGLGARHALGYAAWFMSDGERGEEPPAEMKQVMTFYREIERTVDARRQEELAHRILEINARNLWLIGLVGDLPGLTLVHNSFRNVPDTAVIFGNAGVTAPECYAIEKDPEE